MVIQGDADTTAPVENTRTWIAAMEAMGMEHEYIELAGGGHGDVVGNGMPDIFRFFAEHPRSTDANRPGPATATLRIAAAVTRGALLSTTKRHSGCLLLMALPP